MKIYENIWKWRKLLSSWASLPIPYTHLLLPSLKTAVFFFPSVPTTSPKPRSSLKKCRQNDFTHRFGFPWRWAEKQKIFEILHLLVFREHFREWWNWEDFCRNFSLLLFKTMGGPNVPIKATVQVIHHVDPKDLPMEGHGIKKNVIIRHEKRSDRNRKVPPSCGWKVIPF